MEFLTSWIKTSINNLNPLLIFTACVAYKNQVRTEMDFSYSQTENFEMEELSSDTG